MELFWPLLFLGLGYFVGTAIEKKHYREILAQEKMYFNLPVITSRKIEDAGRIQESELCYGSVVISLDYFKRFLAAMRNIVGGRVKSYESLLDRGRREAILRMKKKAAGFGADVILNLRFETSGIGQVTRKRGSIGSFEILAYGTAVKFKQQ